MVERNIIWWILSIKERNTIVREVFKWKKSISHYIKRLIFIYFIHKKVFSLKIYFVSMCDFSSSCELIACLHLIDVCCCLLLLSYYLAPWNKIPFIKIRVKKNRYTHFDFIKSIQCIESLYCLEVFFC